jgi:WD40-like Beta Propeller Repeat
MSGVRDTRGALLAALAIVVALLGAAQEPDTAMAIYANAADGVEGAQLVSADYAHLEQADDSSRFAAISADGRYVAIETLARNLFGADDPDPPGAHRTGGIFRFDLQTRALEKVADGSLVDDGSGAVIRRGASSPSISADGRYVAFATAEPLIPADGNDNIDVYVRDMTVPLGPGGACGGIPPCAYELVSARDGSQVPASYGPAQFPAPGSNPGADVSRGVSISSDGRKVAFRTEAPSDLPASGAADVPAGQVFLRDLDAETTTLVTRTDPVGQPAGGAVGAALSADGSTVAWTGSNAPAQTRFLEGENTDPTILYYLWRRVADGPAAQTRRITGLSDPDDPACGPGFNNFSQTATGPCFGFLTDPEGTRTSIAGQLPALSADGSTVAFLTGAGPRPNPTTGTGLDLFLAQMTPGLSRKQGTIELTRDPANFEAATSSPIGSVAFAAGGRYLAVTTVRTKFTFPALSLVGPERTVPNVRELYLVDLQNRTLERVARSSVGGDIDGEVLSGATLSADGSRVAFSSFAGNLFLGDANQRPDAFVATKVPDPPEGGGGEEDGDGVASVTVERGGPRLFVRAKAKENGVIVLTVSVPSAGAVKAVATAKLGKPPKNETIANRTTRARGKGSFNVVLRAEPRFRRALSAADGVRSRIKVTFRPARGGKPLHASTSVDFPG